MADPEARVVVTATDATSRAFASAEKNLRTFARSAYQLRSILAGFGVVVSGRMFANWIKDAIEVEKLTKDQALAIGNASKAVGTLNTHFQDLARNIATKLAPQLEKIAKFWDELIFPTGSQFGEAFDKAGEQFGAQVEEVERLQRLLNTQTAGDQNANWFQRFVFGDHADNIAETTRQLAAARAELERLGDVFYKSGNPVNSYMSPNEFFGGGGPDAAQLAFQQKMREQQEKATAAGQGLSPELRAYVERLEEAEKITDSMSTDVEKQVEAWNKAKMLFDEGLLSAETLRRLDESQLQPIEVTAKRLKELGKQANDFAQSMGDSFRDAFSDWILGAERSFSDLLKRMAVQMATSAVFKGLGSLFPGGSFFSNFFGGFRAGGGPVSSGKGYIVGERGPEWFMPGTSGSIVPAGGGVMINQYNTFQSGDQRQQAAALAASNARLKQEIKAEISDSRRRGRPI